MPFDYKSVIKSRKTRQRMLRFFDWVPDRVVVPMQYRIKLGRLPDLRNPRRFTEKLCWYKLNWRDHLMRQCVDKIAVRDYVRDCGLERILTPLLGVYDDPAEIDINALPSKFVLKDSLGGGNNEVIVCADKKAIDWKRACEQMREWVRPRRHRKHPGREWFYDTPGSSRIICEEYLEADRKDIGLVDYKFFCFQNGNVVNYLNVTADRKPGQGGQFGIFKVEGFRKTPNLRKDEKPLVLHIPEPPHYDEMIEVAKRLSRPFPHARVDLYDLGDCGGVRFGEITFCDGSGYFPYEPDEFDFEIGKDFIIPNEVQQNKME